MLYTILCYIVNLILYMAMNKKKRVAIIYDPIIEAMVNGLFSFKSEAMALEMLEYLKKNYIVSSKQEKGKPQVSLWVRGFGLLDEEKKQGFRGHYAIIRVDSKSKKRFSLKAEKIFVELPKHPQRNYPGSRHPNWGHPILRAVKNGKIYKDLVAANEELIRLHEDFPDASIPGVNTLRIMIYNREIKGSSPIQKIIIGTKELEGGTAQLIMIDKPARKPTRKDEKPKLEEVGAFSAMVSKQRKKKSKK